MTVDEAVEAIARHLSAGERREAVLACDDLDDAVLIEGSFSPRAFSLFVEMLRSPGFGDGPAAWRVLKAIENNCAQFSPEQRRELEGIVHALRAQATDGMARYMAQELIIRSFG